MESPGDNPESVDQQIEATPNTDEIKEDQPQVVPAADDESSAEVDGDAVPVNTEADDEKNEGEVNDAVEAADNDAVEQQQESPVENGESADEGKDAADETPADETPVDGEPVDVDENNEQTEDNATTENADTDHEGAAPEEDDAPLVGGLLAITGEDVDEDALDTEPRLDSANDSAEPSSTSSPPRLLSILTQARDAMTEEAEGTEDGDHKDSLLALIKVMDAQIENLEAGRPLNVDQDGNETQETPARHAALHAALFGKYRKGGINIDAPLDAEAAGEIMGPNNALQMVKGGAQKPSGSASSSPNARQRSRSHSSKRVLQGLREIYLFYCAQHRNKNGQPIRTFGDLEHAQQLMILPELKSFARDFGFSPKPVDRAGVEEIFRAVSGGDKTIEFPQFREALQMLADATFTAQAADQQTAQAAEGEEQQSQAVADDPEEMASVSRLMQLYDFIDAERPLEYRKRFKGFSKAFGGAPLEPLPPPKPRGVSASLNSQGVYIPSSPVRRDGVHSSDGVDKPTRRSVESQMMKELALQNERMHGAKARAYTAAAIDKPILIHSRPFYGGGSDSNKYRTNATASTSLNRGKFAGNGDGKLVHAVRNPHDAEIIEKYYNAAPSPTRTLAPLASPPVPSSFKPTVPEAYKVYDSPTKGSSQGRGRAAGHQQSSPSRQLPPIPSAHLREVQGQNAASKTPRVSPPQLSAEERRRLAEEKALRDAENLLFAPNSPTANTPPADPVFLISWDRTRVKQMVDDLSPATSATESNAASAHGQYRQQQQQQHGSGGKYAANVQAELDALIG